MTAQTFGRRALELNSADALVAQEVACGHTDYFSAIDTVVTGIMIRAFRGERVVRITSTARDNALELIGTPDALKAPLSEAFQLEAQQSRGAWFLPESVSIKAHALLFPALFREYPRYAHTLAAQEKGKVALGGNPDAMVVWAVLQSFAETLTAPIEFRVQNTGLLTRDEYIDGWQHVTGSLASLGLALDAELAPFAWGGGWGRFGTDAQLQATAQLLGSIANQLSLTSVRRYRASMVSSLITQYYQKAKAGRAKRKQVITKDHARTLAAFFRGDWSAFVGYLGEELHDDEHIATSLPEPNLAIATEEGNGQPSPMVQRTTAMWHYWSHFDSIHARQAPGMRPLWGLVEEGCGTCLPIASSSYSPGLFREYMPNDLLVYIEGLWGTTVLPKWPECIVTEPFPHTAMAATFGPALEFWHGCALTAWYVCEGPYSRTDIPGLANYYSRQLADLESLGFPVHPQLFRDLQSIQLGPEEPLRRDGGHLDVGYGISLHVSTGSRRRGFERLRDVITHHRQWWASQYLQRYLQMLWETEISSAARQYHMLSAQKGKAPTFKQYAKHAVVPAQHWFGGDVSLLYRAFGQPCPVDIRRSLRLPADRLAFATAVFNKLGGRPNVGQRHGQEEERQRLLDQLAIESLRFVQLVEALERSPTLKEFGPRFQSLGVALSPDVETAWTTYACAVERSLLRTG